MFIGFIIMYSGTYDRFQLDATLANRSETSTARRQKFGRARTLLSEIGDKVSPIKSRSFDVAKAELCT